jgi:UDP-glucose:(heptosyl)LPS alpha-1,3-glucosyltransferase
MQNRVVVIPNGVDARFQPDGAAYKHRSELGLPTEGLVALFVGSEWGRKGLRPALEALTQAPDWHLAVVGEGDRDAYLRFAHERGVSDRVHFFGVSQRVAEFYRAADAFLLPTRYETFSLATYEAAASGLPLLATDVSGIRDLIEDGRNGFFIRPDAALIADRLCKLGADEALRVDMGRAARESSRSFGWEKTIERHERVYAELCAKAR